MKKLHSYTCFDGELGVYEHKSQSLSCDMVFSIFTPPQAKERAVPVLTYLSGLTCTYENFTSKAGAYKYASQHGIAIIAPDTSPRGTHVPDDEAYDFGQGAGFYINATQEPWAKNFQMETYIADELPKLIATEFTSQCDMTRHGLCGHSMGGHGALSLGLKYPTMYKSLSAFSPITAPSKVPWGQKAFKGYLGDNQTEWQSHDSCALMCAATDRASFPNILIDQGLADSFLEEHLKPDMFKQACAKVGQSHTLRLHEGYDHSYYFIQSFIEDHIKHHKEILSA